MNRTLGCIPENLGILHQEKLVCQVALSAGFEVHGIEGLMREALHICCMVMALKVKCTRTLHPDCFCKCTRQF